MTEKRDGQCDLLDPPRDEKRPLRVLQILTNLDRAGMETMTMNYYRHIDRARVQFDFLLHRSERGAYEAEARALGANVFRVPRQNPLSKGYWHALDSFFAEHPYRVVHAQLDCMSAEPLAAAARHGTAVRIAHSHSSRQDRDLKYPLKLVCKRFIKREATDLFACSVEAGRWMFGTDCFRVIPNAIDIGRYAFDEAARKRVRTELKVGLRVPVVGHVGRFMPAKNHEFILRAFQAMLRLRADAVLLLAGEGDLLERTRQRARELGIERSVMFVGVREDVPELMQAMDVFLMPSLYEGLPVVLVEAQAAGLPCVISDAIPPDCDFAGGGIRRLALSAGPDDWASELCRLVAEGRRREEGAAVVRSAGFDIKAAAAWLEDFYLKKAGEPV